MCQPATCKSCSKTTWRGCGQHVDQVMANVPKSQQCTCTPDTTPGAKPQGFFARLFGKN